MVVAQGSSGSIKLLLDAPAAAHDKMGIVKKIVITKEPDMNRTVKKIVQMKAPCAAEMAALMDCFRVRAQGLWRTLTADVLLTASPRACSSTRPSCTQRYASGQSDSACAQHRQALALCAQTSVRGRRGGGESRALRRGRFCADDHDAPPRACMPAEAGKRQRHQEPILRAATGERW